MKAAQYHLRKRFLMRGLPLIAATMLFGCAQSAFGQWASPSPNPNNNIYYNAGNVGIGTTGPTAKLEVSGTVATPSSLATNPITSGTFVLSDTSGTVGAVMGTVLNSYSYDTYLQTRHLTSGNTAYNLLLQPLGGNIGIGTMGAASKLHIATTTDADGLVISNSTTVNGTRAAIYLSTLNATPALGSVSIESMSVASAYPDMVFRTLGVSAVNAIGTERMRITSGGNVGIGTTSPQASLSVNGGTTNINIGGNYGSGYNGIWLNGSTATTHYNLLSRASDGHLVINRPGGSAIVFNENDATTNMVIASGGNVGIGTTSPQASLSVNGGTTNINIGGNYGSGYNGIWLNGSTAATHYNLLSRASDGNLIINRPGGSAIVFNENNATTNMVIASGGNVGIGTMGAASKLHIATTTDADGLVISNSTTVNGTRAAIYLSTLNATPALGSVSIESMSVASAYPDMVFRTLGASAVNAVGTERMRITSTGNVGIGTTSPGDYKLNVNGDTNVSGNLNIVANGSSPGNIVAAGTVFAKYQDVAEWVESSEQLPAGTVVVLDSTKSNQVTASSVSYDTRVAGVISAQPGIALGEKSDSKLLVATTGRVKVKVDASKGPIHIGDLLVTSDVPGVAMKSEAVNLGGVQFHRPGTLIGKALEPLEKGKGEILVLLSLQ